MYNVFNDGKAIKINIKAGIEVQNNSTSCASKKNRLYLLDITEDKIKYIHIRVIIVKIIIE
jgi:hypothetical protein